MSLLTTESVTCPSHVHLSFVQRLYEASFPWEERREFAELLPLLTSSDMQLRVFKAERKTPVGFAVTWSFPDFLFIEHIAISTAERGKGYGSSCMRLLLATHQLCLLEIEPVHNVISEKRLRFYTQLGFSQNNRPYFQPPYHAGNLSIPMWLLASRPISPIQADQFVSQIYSTVYKAKS